MTYASFANLPASTEFPARLIDVGRDIPTSRGKRRLTVPLTSTGACELLKKDGAY